MSAVSRLLYLSTIAIFFLPAIAAADCAAPSSPGVRICAPTPNATVVYFSNVFAQIPALDFNSAPAFGAEIVKYSVYDNNHKISQDSTGASGAQLELGSIKNGLHRLVVNAWDSSGVMYQSAVTVFVQ